MPCEAGFSDSRCNEQTTNNPRPVASHTALRLLEDDLERARDVLLAAINEATESLGVFGYRFPDPGEEAKDADWTHRYQRSIRAIIKRHDDMEEAIDAAFADYGWEVKRATRALRQALDRGPAP